MISYNKPLFIKSKRIVEDHPRLIEIAEKQIQAHVDGRQEWQEAALYNRLIYVRTITDLPTPKPRKLSKPSREEINKQRASIID